MIDEAVISIVDGLAINDLYNLVMISTKLSVLLIF